FYIKNTNATDTLRNAKLWIESNDVNGLISIGINVINEIQKLVVTGTGFPNEGNFFELEVPDYTPTFKVLYDPNITKWVGNFQEEIRGVEGLPEVRVTAEGEVPNVTFTIDFGGEDKTAISFSPDVKEIKSIGQARSRNISLIEVTMPDGDQLDNATPTPMDFQDGSPVNTEAPLVASVLTPPPGITFSFPLRGNPIELGNLRPGDEVPVWAKRVVSKNTVAKIKGNFILHLEGTFP
ncbi:MAG: hypothetical protein GTO02_02685, partial [Candidatus Dadabacteria bacterium]|nr:hypothetical protein [Candidatus Dadabacteria bacterium]